jgi:flagellar basal-body rod protein FlgB
MINRLLGGEANLALERALDGASLRHRALAENLANVNTPGYKRLEVDFVTALRRAVAGADVPLRRTDARHLPGEAGALAEVRPSAWRVQETTGRADRNNVDPDAELAKLAENTLLYNSLTQVLGRRLATLRFAINEGRR